MLWCWGWLGGRMHLPCESSINHTSARSQQANPTPSHPPHHTTPPLLKSSLTCDDRYYDAWVDDGDGHLYLQLEWCPGGSLDDLVFAAAAATDGGGGGGGQGAERQPPPRPQRKGPPGGMESPLLVCGGGGGGGSAAASLVWGRPNPFLSSGSASAAPSPMPPLPPPAAAAAAHGSGSGSELGMMMMMGQQQPGGRQVKWRGTEAELLVVLRDAALALHHMHRRGIAHMDVKVSRGGRERKGEGRWVAWRVERNSNLI